MRIEIEVFGVTFLFSISRKQETPDFYGDTLSTTIEPDNNRDDFDIGFC